MFKVWKSTREEPIILSDSEKQKRIKELRKMIQIADLDLRIDDIYMTRWLHCRDWDVELAFKRVTKFNNFKKENPDWYMTRSISSYEYLLKKNIAVMLDGRDRRGRRVYLIRCKYLNPDYLSIHEMAQINYIWQESVADELKTIESGLAVLLDFKDTPWKLCKWFTPANSKLSFKSTGLCPLKNFVIHMVNVSTTCTAIMGMMSPFLSAQLRNKFCLHFSDFSLLHKCLGKDVLPEEYGGNAKLDYKKAFEKLHKWDERMKGLNSNGKTKNQRNSEINKENVGKCNIVNDSSQQIIAAID